MINQLTEASSSQKKKKKNFDGSKGEQTTWIYSDSSRDVEDEQHFLTQLTVMLDKSMSVFFSRPYCLRLFSLTLNQLDLQMHVVVFSESVFHLENLLYPPDISMNACLCVVFCLLAPCWSPGH